ncbi:MAG TPA: protein-L-isoaspartate(D-aspartate) O-methyltransferase [Steroidobacteraceae bacterium]
MYSLRNLLICGIAAIMSKPGAATAQDTFESARVRMVEQQLAARDITDERVLAAMRKVPRHRFVPPQEERYAYADTPLPIGEGQTISQPYIVALMTQLARPAPTDRALEIGTGSGYQAAVLAELVDHVYTIELEPTLAERARRVLTELGYENVTARAGDGYAGWPEHAPFDIIIVTAAPDHVPQPLIEQLKPGGRMVVPVGPVGASQRLRLIEKDSSGKIKTRDLSPVRFVPLRRDADE